ncbi:hypothetical protein OROHE_012450 [Orobanche hederae]
MDQNAQARGDEETISLLKTPLDLSRGDLFRYASVVAIESTSKLDDELWLAYWILYSFLTLMEMVLQHALEMIPIWYDVKLAFVAGLVLPEFRGLHSSMRNVIKKYGAHFLKSHNGKDKNKFFDTKKVVLLICVTKVAKSAFDKALAEHEHIDDLVGSEEPTERDHGVDFQRPLLMKIYSSDSHQK